jgi:hypothetical protein
MPLVEQAIVRLQPHEAEALVAEFEANGGMRVDSSQRQLLDRYFMESDDVSLSERYRAALAQHESPATAP